MQFLVRAGAIARLASPYLLNLRDALLSVPNVAHKRCRVRVVVLDLLQQLLFLLGLAQNWLAQRGIKFPLAHHELLALLEERVHPGVGFEGRSAARGIRICRLGSTAAAYPRAQHS